MEVGYNFDTRGAKQKLFTFHQDDDAGCASAVVVLVVAVAVVVVDVFIGCITMLCHQPGFLSLLPPFLLETSYVRKSFDKLSMACCTPKKTSCSITNLASAAAGTTGDKLYGQDVPL